MRLSVRKRTLSGRGTWTSSTRTRRTHVSRTKYTECLSLSDTICSKHHCSKMKLQIGHPTIVFCSECHTVGYSLHLPLPSYGCFITNKSRSVIGRLKQSRQSNEEFSFARQAISLVAFVSTEQRRWATTESRWNSQSGR